ncbi:hypothetical protein ASD15_27685 [Massilia sp. Root351]|uniref:tetratricopeptide repeat protein n=1 Tax=Massilia sp. Root351 TaxID=1736522 RepID=UPI00070E0EFD|nr:tetratricopeptide repeat protein [Massilia sp. Root351]KQV87837.1 hypothetical protein ASD15_27685 [Massilia sp. Root351]
MSLLMQALKKAERSKQNSLPDEEAAEKPSEAFDGVLALTPQDLTPEQLHPRAAEFSLAPLDEPLMPETEAEQIPALTPAEEAPHDPTPPQARVGGARTTRSELSLQDLQDKPAQAAPLPQALQPAGPAQAAWADTGLQPPSPAAALAAAGRPDARVGDRRQGGGQRISDHFNSPAGRPAGDTAGGMAADAGTANGGVAHSGIAHGSALGGGEAGKPAAGATARPAPASGAAARARAAAAARATTAEDKVGWDPARIRLAVLSGILLLVVALFGYLYWRATSVPGPGAHLPMVPMPPPDAAGAKSGTVVVPPGGAPGTPGSTAGTLAGPAPLEQQGVSPGQAPGGDHAGAPLAAPPPSYAPLASQGGAARGPSGSSSMLGSARNAAPAANTVMATPEEIERAMQMQAGQQSGTPPPFAAAAAPAAGVAGQGGALQGGPASAPAAGWSSASAASPAGGAGTRPADASWASSDIKVSRRSNAPRIDPALQYGYRALLDGDLPTAADQYAAALRQDPNSRDALLGSAAVAQRRNDAALASASYMRLLELDPSDPEALAGMLSLRPGDTGQSERRLKELLRKSPDSAPLQFALGNLYSRQSRWTDAQQAYFRAYSASPDNPDYAFNLAVGLDRLNQPKLALTYYQRALALSQAGPAGFDSEAVRARMRQLAEPN